jgi:hypothetical protein
MLNPGNRGSIIPTISQPFDSKLNKRSSVAFLCVTDRIAAMLSAKRFLNQARWFELVSLPYFGRVFFCRGGWSCGQGIAFDLLAKAS